MLGDNHSGGVTGYVGFLGQLSRAFLPRNGMLWPEKQHPLPSPRNKRRPTEKKLQPPTSTPAHTQAGYPGCQAHPMQGEAHRRHTGRHTACPLQAPDGTALLCCQGVGCTLGEEEESLALKAVHP